MRVYYADIEYDRASKKEVFMQTTPSITVDALRLEVIMREKGFSMRSLSRKMSCHIATLYRIKETGHVSFGTLEEMCAALECHPFDLLVARGYPPVRLPRMGESLFLPNGDRT